MKKIFLIIICGLYTCLTSFAAPQKIVNFYISTKGSDLNTGTINAPFLNFEKARQAIADFKLKQPGFSGKLILNFRSGTYFLDKTITFNSGNSGTPQCQVIYQSFPGEKAILSGGKILSGTWQKQPGIQLEGTPDERAIWKLHIKETENKKWYFRQLFSEGRRLMRATTGLLYTNGPLPQYLENIKPYDFVNAGKLKETNLDAWCGFQFRNDDIKNWHDLASAEVITYHSWECSWQKIYEVNEKNHTVKFKSPSRYPIGFFNNATRYRIENIKSALDNFGEWYLDSEKGDLYYYAFPNEDPNTKEFIVPVLEKLMTFTGDISKPISNVLFKDLTFSYSDVSFNKTSLSKEMQAKAEQQYAWLDIASGYTDAQAAPEAGCAISLYATNNCIFESCNFSHLGAYALQIGSYCNKNEIQNCSFNDTGAGGVIIGFNERLPYEKNISVSSSPSYNRVYNSFIYDGGLIHPSAVGILIMQANNNTISHNEVFNFPYSGISCGWTWGSQPNFTKANSIEFNHIHHVMTELADGAGIYTLGKQEGCIIRDNYIHNVSRKADAIGSFNNGIFFDEGSSGMKISNNVIQDIQNQPVRFNRAEPKEIIFTNNYLDTNHNSSKTATSIMAKAGHMY